MMMRPKRYNTFRSLAHKTRKAPPKRRRAESPGCERLETRALLATLIWSGNGATGLWSDPANWDGSNTPSATFDQLVFPAGAANQAMTDDLGQMTLGLEFQDSGYTLIESGAGRIDLDASHGVTVTAAGGSTIIEVRLQAADDSNILVSNAGATLEVAAQIGVDAGATLHKAGDGVLHTNAQNAGTLQGILRVTEGALQIPPSAGFDSGTILLDGGELTTDAGAAAVASSLAATSNGGSFSPGGDGGIGSLSFYNGAVTLNQITARMEIQGASPGSYDKLTAMGGSTSFNLTGSTLELDTTGYAPAPGDQIVLIDYAGGLLTGEFSNAPQGATVNLGGIMFTVDYAGGGGTQVILSPAAGLTAQDDVYSLPPNTSLVTGSAQPSLFVSIPGVLGNDTTPYGQPLTPVLVDQAQHGVVLLNTDGSFTYQPAVGFSGTDTFTYRAVDGLGHSSNSATVTLYINKTNLSPVAYPDNYTAAQGQPSSVSVIGNDYSPSGNPLTALIVAGPAHGTLIDNGNGSFTYTPNADFTGVDGFIYAARDAVTGLTSDAMNVIFNVGVHNLAPTAVDEAYSTNQNTALFVVGPGVLINDIDPNNDTLSSVVVDNPLHGTLTLSSNGSFDYVPDPNFHGVDTFTYRISDGFLTSANVATVTITVRAVNNAPIALPDSYRVNEDGVLQVDATFGVLANDTDADGDSLTAQLVNTTQYGALILNPDGSFTYTPDPHHSGSDSFTYRAFDGSLRSELTTVTLTINPVNHAPVANPDAFSAVQGRALHVSGPGALANDTDLENSLLSAVLIDAAIHGSLTLNSDGSFDYIPDPNFQGADSFTYRASDGGLVSDIAKVSINVIAMNRAPIAQNDSYTIKENQRLNVAAPGVLGNDADADGDLISAILVNGPQNGALTLNADGSFTYTPYMNFSGDDAFTYRAGDGKLQSNLATVTIHVTAQAPLTIALDPTSDTGQSSSDRITNDNTPTFQGGGEPGLYVILSARPVGSTSAPTAVGSSTVDASGNWTITSLALPDGSWDFFAEGKRPDGLSTGSATFSGLVIDTVGPQIVGAVLGPRNNQVAVTFQDNSGGMAQSTLSNPANYALTKNGTHAPRLFVIDYAQPLPAQPGGVRTVILNSSADRLTRVGRYVFTVLAGGIADVAGNALDGAFNGSYPSGDGHSGANFNAEFVVRGLRPVSATPTHLTPPILSVYPGGLTRGGGIPRGPAGRPRVRISPNGNPVVTAAANLGASRFHARRLAVGAGSRLIPSGR